MVGDECPCCQTVVKEVIEENSHEDSLDRKKECPKCDCLWWVTYDLSMPDTEIIESGEGFDEQGWYIGYEE